MLRLNYVMNFDAVFFCSSYLRGGFIQGILEIDVKPEIGQVVTLSQKYKTKSYVLLR